MNINENIIKLAEGIASAIKEHGEGVQLYGSWNKDFTEEERAQLSAQLRERGIETIKLYDYAELYIVADLDSEKKEQVIANYKKSTPVAFEQAAAEYHQRKREMMAMESIAHAVAEALMEIMGGEFDEDDGEDDDVEDEEDYDDDEDYDEEYDSDEE